MSIQVRLITDDTEIEQFSGAWEEYQSRLVPAHIEHHPRWTAIEAQTRREKNWQPAVVALHREGNLDGLAPLLLKDYDWSCRLGYMPVARFPLRMADFCGSTPPLREETAAREALLSFLCRKDVPFQMIFLESLPVDSEWWRLLHTSPDLRRRYWLYKPEGIVPHWLIDMPETFDAYCALQFSKGGRKKIRKWFRRIEEAGLEPIQLHRITRREEVSSFLEQTERISSRSWQGQRLGKVIASDEKERARIEAYADQGWLRSYLLTCGGAPIAFQIAYQYQGKLYLEETGYDSEWKEFSPGNLLLYRMIEDLYAADMPEWVDFGYGENENKQFFCNHRYEDSNLFLIKKSPYTALAFGVHAGCAYLSWAVRCLLDRVNMRGKVRHFLRNASPASGKGSEPKKAAGFSPKLPLGGLVALIGDRFYDSMALPMKVALHEAHLLSSMFHHV